MSQENFARRETKIKALRAGENINNLAEILEKLKTLITQRQLRLIPCSFHPFLHFIERC